MRVLVLITLTTCSFVVWSQTPAPTPRRTSKPQQQQSRSVQKPTEADQRGTDQSPLIVKTLPAAKTETETQQIVTDRKEKTANDTHIVELTGVLAVVALLQLLVYTYQAKKLRETVQSAGEQFEAMERRIGEAARSATAMEQIANTIEAGNQAVLRAYITVTIGSAVYQERRGPGLTDLKFEGKPNVLNPGNTPARNLRIRISADILPIPIPKEFQFPLGDENDITDAGVLGAHQTSTVSGIVKDLGAC